MKITNKSNGNVVLRGVTAQELTLNKNESKVFENRLLTADYIRVLDIFKHILDWDLNVETEEPIKVETPKTEEKIVQVEPTQEKSEDTAKKVAVKKSKSK